MDEPQGSRLFIVCGKAAEANDLEDAFKQYGHVQYVKMVRDKGVAYVKFDRASTAAKAMEELNGVVLNDGRGPQLKVLQADSPTRSSPRQPSADEIYQDPVNHPPRSRLFLVVPRTADEQLLQEEMSKYDGLEYCKTDLIVSKGIAFAKYSKASQALLALEEINKTNMLAGYRIKCMLAEPKLRNKGPVAMDMSALALAGDPLLFQGMEGSVGNFQGLDHLLQTSGLAGLSAPCTPQMGNFQGIGGVDQVDWTLAQLGMLDMQQPQQPFDPFGNIQNLEGKLNNLSLNGQQVAAGQMTPSISPMTPMNRISGGGGGVIPESPLSSAPSGQRLFVVVHKGVAEEQLARVFRKFSGMEYCDLKRDRVTAKSKGYAYVNYSTPEAAQAAIDHFNGIEFPQGSGTQLKVMLAEPLIPRNRGVRWASFESVGDMGVDPRVVHFYLEKPLPDYALKNVFDEHCHIESIQLDCDDPRMGFATTFTADDAQRLALTMNGQNIVGVPIFMYLNNVCDPNNVMQPDNMQTQAIAQDVFEPHLEYVPPMASERPNVN